MIAYVLYMSKDFLRTGKCTTPQISLVRGCLWPDIKVEYINWQTHRRAGVGDVHDTGHMPLDGST